MRTFVQTITHTAHRFCQIMPCQYPFPCRIVLSMARSPVAASSHDRHAPFTYVPLLQRNRHYSGHDGR